MRIGPRISAVFLAGALAGAAGCTKIVTKRLEGNASCAMPTCADGGLDGGLDGGPDDGLDGGPDASAEGDAGKGGDGGS
jgi:hypothetical protein